MGLKLTSPNRTIILNGEDGEERVQTLYGSGRRGRRGKEIAYKYHNKRPYVTPKKHYKSFSTGALSRTVTPLGELTTLPPHSLVGRGGDIPPHSPAPRRLGRLASLRLRRFDLGAGAYAVNFSLCRQ